MEDKVHIYYVKHTEKLDDSVYKHMLSHLSEPLQEEIKAYKHEESAQASLLGKILLLYALKQLHFDKTLHDIEVGYKDRPFINEDFDFNITHSGEYVLVAITKFAKVGIDIEKHRQIDVMMFRKYFDKNEWEEIKSAPVQRLKFFELWSMKECAIKCDGRGVEVLGVTHKNYDSETINCDGKLFYYKQINIDENYACCACCDRESEFEIKKVELSELKQF